jgi:hypothetical protein
MDEQRLSTNDSLGELVWGYNFRAFMREDMNISDWNENLHGLELKGRSLVLFDNLKLFESIFQWLRRFINVRCPKQTESNLEKKVLIEVVRDESFDPFKFAMKFVEEQQKTTNTTIFNMINNLASLEMNLLEMDFDVNITDFKEETYFMDYGVNREEDNVDPLKYNKMLDLFEMQMIETFGSFDKYCRHVGNNFEFLEFESREDRKYSYIWNKLMKKDKNGVKISITNLPAISTKQSYIDKMTNEIKNRERTLLNLQRLMRIYSAENTQLQSSSKIFWESNTQ